MWPQTMGNVKQLIDSKRQYTLTLVVPHHLVHHSVTTEVLRCVTTVCTFLLVFCLFYQNHIKYLVLLSDLKLSLTINYAKPFVSSQLKHKKYQLKCEISDFWKAYGGVGRATFPAPGNILAFIAKVSRYLGVLSCQEIFHFPLNSSNWIKQSALRWIVVLFIHIPVDIPFRKSLRISTGYSRLYNLKFRLGYGTGTICVYAFRRFTPHFCQHIPHCILAETNVEGGCSGFKTNSFVGGYVYRFP